MKDLFKDFPPSTKDAWVDKVKGDLKGKSIGSLDWRYSDISFSPFYHQEDQTEKNSAILNSKVGNDWIISQSINTENPHSANAKALTALNQGATGLSFEIHDQNNFKFNNVLKDIQLEWIFTEFILVGIDSLVFTEKLLSYAEGRGFDITKVKGAIYESKPVKNFDILEIRKGLFPKMKLIKIGANSAKNSMEELTSILTQSKNHLKRHNNKRTVAESLLFELKVNDIYFGNIAKIRALRVLLANLFKAYGLDDCHPFISVKIRHDHKVEDENYNFIRYNTQALSAAIGGAEMLSIIPPEHSKGEDFSSRISLNINHLLQLESHMNRVSDPSAGSYFIEHMTDELCIKAWEHFQSK